MINKILKFIPQVMGDQCSDAKVDVICLVIVYEVGADFFLLHSHTVSPVFECGRR